MVYYLIIRTESIHVTRKRKSKTLCGKLLIINSGTGWTAFSRGIDQTTGNWDSVSAYHDRKDTRRVDNLFYKYYSNNRFSLHIYLCVFSHIENGYSIAEA